MLNATTLLLALGIAGLLWSIGLSLWLAYLDAMRRRASLLLMRNALVSILERTGELRRNDGGESRSIF